MTGKAAPEPGDPQDPRTDAATLVQGLARLRDALDQRLDRIEAMALGQAVRLQEDAPERERALRDRVEHLEASIARLHAEAKRREQEWQAGLLELDSDRRLLADAWERLEQSQIDAPQRSAGDPGRPPPGPRPEPAAAVPRQETVDADDPVTRAILRQFQTLKSDVRRNAKGRKGR